jgi:A/G-specific adenine glycosylase
VAGKPGLAHAPIRRALLKWFRVNERTLPWRGTGDPYAIWVSEIMLQQTQIATVTPFYERFIKAFPTVSHLARAPLERVLELWSGLGYYRRARHLHQAAQAVAQQFGGKLPEDYLRLRTLPGIGDYTAKAVLSIAFNQPYAVLDGNVARVVARLSSRRGNLHLPQFRSNVETELAGLLSHQEPGNFNQALMELGQTLCLPRGPHCSACPLARWCGGFLSGNPEDFPLPRPRRAAESHHLAVALLRHGTSVAMMRGLDGGLLGDLWNFPAAFGGTPVEALEALRQKLAGLLRAPAGNVQGVPELAWGEPMGTFRHGITYRSIHGQIYPVETADAFRRASLHWFKIKDLPQAAISQLARKIVQIIGQFDIPKRSKSGAQKGNLKKSTIA